MKKVLPLLGLLTLIGIPLFAGITSESLKENLSTQVEPVLDASLDPDVIDKLKSKLLSVNQNIPILAIRSTQIKGVYEVVLASEELLYINADGTHFVIGDLFELQESGNLVNLSETGRNIARSAFNEKRVEAIAAIDQETYITFPATGESKAVLTVFTDVECAYCRKLHSEMADYNALGIEIRYAAFPRAGVNSKSYTDMVSAWCSPDKNESITRLKQMRSIPAADCNNPVQMHMAVGQEVGVTGTPALVTENGEMIPGYVPPAQLAARLNIN